MYDLTQPLTANIPRFPGDPKVWIEPTCDDAPWQISNLSLGTHSGTHMDAPRHRIPDAPAGIGAYGPDRLVGRGFAIEARGFAENQPIPASVLDGVRDAVWPG